MTLGSYGVGLQTPTLTDLDPSLTYYVAFAADNGSADPAWTDALIFSTSALSVSIPAEVYENDPAAQAIVITRPAGDTSLPLTVNLAYSGDAYPNAITELPATVIIPAGDASISIPFSMVDNNTSDGNISLTVTLLPGAYALPAQASATLTIVDDEAASGGDCTWTGNGDGSTWEDPNNWDPHRVPRFVDNAIFVSAANPILSTPKSIQKLIFRTTGAVTIASGDSSARLTLGGIEREDIEGNESVHAINVPLYIYAPDGVNCVWNISGSQKLQIGGNLMLAAGKITLLKQGLGTLEMNYKNSSYAGMWNIYEGVVSCAQENSLRASTEISIGGSENRAQLNQNHQIRITGGVNITVYTNGYFYCGNCDSGRINSIHVKEGGYADVGYIYSGRAYLTGGFIDMTGWGYWTGLYGQEIRTYASATMARMRSHFNHSSYYDMSMNVEDGEAPVDFLLEADIREGANDKSFSRSGAGVVKMTYAMSNKSKVNLNAGTWLADNTSGSAVGTHLVTVGSNATLGGRGFCGGVATNKTITVNGTVAPGSIDNVTGEHLHGTLTVGSEEYVTPCLFRDNSKLRIQMHKDGKEPLVDALVVHGTLDLSSSKDTLELVLPEVRTDVPAGTYVIASATDGIIGSFDTVINPLQGVVVTQGTHEITVTVPFPNTLILMR